MFGCTKLRGSELLGVTEQCHSPQYPVFRRLVVALQANGGDIGEVGATWLLVDRAEIELWVSDILLQVHCKYVDDGDGNKQHFWRGLCQASILLVPSSSIQKQTIHIHACEGDNKVSASCVNIKIL